ncbi:MULTISPECIES: hypothetical protein [Escherichia]|nr:MULTISPECIES: hypothetical protein [Escherichia]MCM5040373.1 hypothetical protein [Escherichia coli]MDI0482606.1 hypothetical protein [Escherichia coli]MDI0483718.1 hypothetical protein [Escherichia coli]MDI0839134.1 hypothetical protein [Escherichia coli]MDI1058233.1 hypothetical protein [Escherichia coli]
MRADGRWENIGGMK